MFREFRIRRTLRRLAKQRVALILKPGNIWVVERALTPDDNEEADLQTCIMRGWIEILHDAVPSKRMPDQDSNFSLQGAVPAPIYKLTDGGWAVLNRDYLVSILTLGIGILSLASIFG